MLGISFFIPSAPNPPKARGRRGFGGPRELKGQRNKRWLYVFRSFRNGGRIEETRKQPHTRCSRLLLRIYLRMTIIFAGAEVPPGPVARTVTGFLPGRSFALNFQDTLPAVGLKAPLFPTR